ncbi:MAG: hypothetical protein EOO32_00740 [Comamonadaceae bacterium]|nr:MAG: hypothetical protein EOO32_00740 [Comamonadaceae bacterium]
MQTKLIKGIEPLAIDKKVLAVTKKNASPWDAGDRYRIAVRNEQGAIYRIVEAGSLGIYVGVVEGLEALGMTNEVDATSTVDGYDAIFRLADTGTATPTPAL